MTTEFLITSLVVILLPGTGVIYTLALGIGGGFRAGLLAAFGCTLGIVPHILASVAGLAAVLHASALAFAVVKYAGVAYLLYMAWQTLKEHGALKVETKADARSAWLVLRDGLALNLLNPKLSIFFVAFLPQFIVAGEASPGARMLELSGVFMAMTFIVFALYGLFAAAMRDKVISRPAVMAWLRRSFAAAFVALGAKLALTER